MNCRITLLCLTAALGLGLVNAGTAGAEGSGPSPATTTPTSASSSGVTPTPTTSPPATPGRIWRAAQPIPDQYIVALKNTTPSSVPAAAADLAAKHGGTVLSIYQHALEGFAVRMSAAQASALSEEPAVAAVQENGTVHATTSQPGVDPIGATGLDRIDQQAQPLDNTYHYGSTGSGVHAYIIDTGIQTSIPDFGGRASFGDDEINPSDHGPVGTDCYGHGTHVSGILGGSIYGVAKQVSLVDVRVLDCSGSGSDIQVMGGIDWVTAHAILPAVANMSLGTPNGRPDPMIDTEVTKSIATGITYAVAAGNDSADACNASPSDTGGTQGPALTAAASDPTNDVIASFTNTGSCVDLYAPGVNITSDGTNTGGGICPNPTCTLSGTSMATPHVAGAAALYLSDHTAATPATVKLAIDNDATPNVVVFAGPPNRLLYTGPGAPALNVTTGPQSAMLSWTLPADNSVPRDGGSPITSYNIYRGTTSGGEALVTSVPASTTTLKDPSLPCGETFFYEVSAVNAVGETRSSEQTAAPCGAGYFPLPPARILDTRTSVGGHPGPLGQGQILTLQVTGAGSVPPAASGVSSVVLNVTVTNETQASFLTVFPTGEAVPNASNLNFVPGRDVPNRVTVELSPSGQVSFYNNAGSTDVVADVGGYFNSSPSGGDGFAPVTPPQRVLDTRTSLGGHQGPLGQGQALTLSVTGVAVPTGADAVVLNVTATDETQPSFLTVYPSNVGLPTSSDLNIYPGTDIPNLVVVKLSASGQVKIYNNAGSTDVVADVAGYYQAGAARHFIAVPPARILDTRTSIGGHPGPLGQGQSLALTVQGNGGLPASGVTAIVMNVTVTDATQPSFLTVYPSAASPPNASNLNFVPGQDVPNLVVVGTGTGKQVSFFNNAGSVDVVGDIAGYYQ